MNSARKFCLIFAALCACLDAAGSRAATPMVSSGEYHGAALNADGTVRTWGYDLSGQLGTGRLLQSSTPIAVTTISGTTAISTGSLHVLTIAKDGSVWAWGQNTSGQLGSRGPVNASTPAQVLGMSGAIAVSGGGSHSLALKSDGSVWAWGANSSGQLGDGTIAASRSAPTQVAGLSGVTAIAAGGNTSLALKKDGTVWAWGDNSSGQIGDGTTINRPAPVQIGSLAGITAISADMTHALALKSDGSVWAWGGNAAGQIGDGTTTGRPTPIRIASLTGVTGILAGGDTSVALKADGSVWAWGFNFYGQVGDGTTTNRSAPVQITALGGVTGISASYSQTLVVKSDGSVWSWGLNTNGELGAGTPPSRLVPAQISGLSGATAVAAYELGSFVLKSDGSLLVFGYNYGTFGDGSPIIRSAPIAVPGLSGVTAISASGRQTFALKSDGTVWAWGNNTYGELGDGTFGTNRSAPVQVSGLTGVTAIAAGYGHTLALKSDGTVWAWGYDALGQIGDGTNVTRRPLAVQVSGLAGVTAIAAGENVSFAVKSDGSAWAWGDNTNGQLGDGTTTNRSTPVPVSGLTGVVAVSASGLQTLSLKSDGTVWAWGYNGNGQLGNGTTSSGLLPARVSGVSGATAIATGGVHSTALKSDGTVWAWGDNSFGEIGDGTNTNRFLPTQVSALTGVSAIAAGGGNFPPPASGAHTIALKSDGTVLTWGDNDLGELGDGTGAARNAPVVVLRENAGGSLATNDWFLDLIAGGSVTIPAARTPPFLAVTDSSDSDSSKTVIASIKFNAAQAGKSGGVYITAQIPAGAPLPSFALSRNSNFAQASIQPLRQHITSGSGSYALIQLTPTGWQPVTNGQLTPFATGVLGAALADQSILSNTDTTAIPGATFCLGYGTSAQDMTSSGRMITVATVADSGATAPAPSCVVTSSGSGSAVVPQAGYWWNTAEGGRGFTIEQNAASGSVFFACYLYTANGAPVWYAAGPAPMTGSTFSAPMLAYQNGQTLSGAYQQAQQGTSPGNVSIVFSDASHAMLTWPGGTIPIQRYEFSTGGLSSPPVASQPESGYWWNPGEGGRGYTVEVQNGVAFIATYMYDSSGNAVWYASGPQAVIANTYIGPLTEHTGGQTLTGPYHSPTAALLEGTITIQFTSSTAGTLTLPDGNQIPIQRFGF